MADGDSAIVERLVTEWDANTDKILAKLNGLNRSVHGTASAIDKAFALPNLEKSLDKVFDSSRLTLLNEAGARLRVFGSALEPLGIMGIGAAAGIVAAAVAMDKAAKAAEWASQLSATAQKLGVTTGALQLFDYVALKSGIPVDVMRESLAKLNEKIGDVQSNIARPLSARPFEALKLKPEDLRRLQTLQAILPEIAERIRALPAAQREGIAERLGIEPLLPALMKGKQGIADLMAEAKNLGFVIDDSIIQQSSKAAEKLRVASEIIDRNLKSAFLELAPAIAAGAGELAVFVHWLSGPLDRAIRASIDLLKAWKHQAELKLGAEGKDLWRVGRDLTGPIFTPVSSADILDALDEKPGGGKGTFVPGPAKHGPDVAKLSADAIDKAMEEELKAREALTKNLEARLAIELALLATEKAKQTADLEGQVREKKITRAAADKAEALDAQAAAEKEQLLRRTTAYEIEDRQIAIYKLQTEALLQQLEDEAAIAKSASERRTLEDKILALRQQLEKDLEGTQIDRKRRDDELSPAQAAASYAAIEQRQAADAAKQRQADFLDANPLQKYLQDSQASLGPDLGKTIQQMQVDGLKEFNRQLTEAIVNSKDLGQVFGNMARMIESDLVSMMIEKYLTIPLAQAFGLISGGGSWGGGLLSMFGAMGASGGGGSGDGGGIGIVQAAASIPFSSIFPGFASGTDSAPGGLALIGEDGPEIMNVPRGAQILPNSLLRSLTAVPTPAGAGPSFTFDLRGAVMTEDLLAQMNDMADNAKQAATMAGAQLGVMAARKLIPAEMARRQSLSIR